ncbi:MULTISPECIES: ImmA/IrrE family metallo-endopeptidase [Brachybacterium]|uniref:ImmA/IrrE family metallo-endopeptidase n=1 Tax=Brachybacterium TaxID=43668 RepID=UPI0009EB33C8|nr:MULTISPECIES: ImmA/IrrE family metallo-endopeptidase [Brachybacterium]
MVTMEVAPSMLRWALDRADMNTETKRYARFESYASGQKQPTMNQLEEFANATHVPFGYLFLPEPPREDIPIPDFRTIRDERIRQPSANLLDTIYEAQMRQDWYREYARSQGAEPLRYYGSASLDDSPVAVADNIREALKFDMDRRSRFGNWETALRYLIDAIEEIGILVMVSSIVGNNTHRSLSLREFRGFTLGDPYAAVIFVNGADSKSAQMFTLLHELAHVWLGESGLSNEDMTSSEPLSNERWANMVAAEILIPRDQLRADYRGALNGPEVTRLVRLYKTSSLVVIKRVHDAGLVDWDTYLTYYRKEETRLKEILDRKRKSPGGDYYNSHPLQIGQQFTRAVIVDTYEGRTLYRDAFRLLGTSKAKTFEGLAERLGVA